MYLFSIVQSKSGLLLVALLICVGFNPVSAQTGTWKKLDTQPYLGNQDDISFINEKEGWYINGDGKLYKTTNGGTSWKKQWERPGSFFRAIVFLDDRVGFLGTVGTNYFPNVNDGVPLYCTTDGGDSWEPVAYEGPKIKGVCAIDLVKERIIKHGKINYKTHLFAVGRVGSPANIMVSHDGGKNWLSQSMNGEAKMLLDIKMFDKDNGIICGATSADIAQSNALVLKTSDGGNTWKKVYQSKRPYETAWKLSFPTRDVGYLTIQSYNPNTELKQQRVAKTIDGGENWEELDLVEDEQARPFGVGFIDENHGFVGTYTSGYETRDGGQTWSPTDLGFACNKIRFYRDDTGSLFGYAIGVSVLKYVVR